MEKVKITNSLPGPPQLDRAFTTSATADQQPLSRFDQMVERMKGTGRIVGDILSPDSDIWTCEIE